MRRRQSTLTFLAKTSWSITLAAAVLIFAGSGDGPSLVNADILSIVPADGDLPAAGTYPFYIVLDDGDDEYTAELDPEVHDPWIVGFLEGDESGDIELNVNTGEINGLEPVDMSDPDESLLDELSDLGVDVDDILGKFIVLVVVECAGLDAFDLSFISEDDSDDSTTLEVECEGSGDGPPTPALFVFYIVVDDAEDEYTAKLDPEVHDPWIVGVLEGDESGDLELDVNTSEINGLEPVDMSDPDESLLEGLEDVGADVNDLIGKFIVLVVVECAALDAFDLSFINEDDSDDSTTLEVECEGSGDGPPTPALFVFYIVVDDAEDKYTAKLDPEVHDPWIVGVLEGDESGDLELDVNTSEINDLEPVDMSDPDESLLEELEDLGVDVDDLIGKFIVLVVVECAALDVFDLSFINEDDSDDFITLEVECDGSGDDPPPDPDFDNDGVRDFEDNCPSEPNADQADNDGDAQGDACDRDDDNDGVADSSDNCPFHLNSSQTDSDSDGIGDACDSTPLPPTPTSQPTLGSGLGVIIAGAQTARNNREAAAGKQAISPPSTGDAGLIPSSLVVSPHQIWPRW